MEVLSKIQYFLPQSWRSAEASDRAEFAQVVEAQPRVSAQNPLLWRRVKQLFLGGLAVAGGAWSRAGTMAPTTGLTIGLAGSLLPVTAAMDSVVLANEGAGGDQYALPEVPEVFEPEMCEVDTPEYFKLSDFNVGRLDNGQFVVVWDGQTALYGRMYDPVDRKPCSPVFLIADAPRLQFDSLMDCGDGYFLVELRGRGGRPVLRVAGKAVESARAYVLFERGRLVMGPLIDSREYIQEFVDREVCGHVGCAKKCHVTREGGMKGVIKSVT